MPRTRMVWGLASSGVQLADLFMNYIGGIKREDVFEHVNAYL